MRRVLALPLALVTMAGTTSVRAHAPSPAPATHATKTVYEHQDHRMLPVGTKIYYSSDGGQSRITYVYPGTLVPASVAGRQPSVIVVGPYDRRADVRERTKPAQACCGAHLER